MSWNPENNAHHVGCIKLVYWSILLTWFVHCLKSVLTFSFISLGLMQTFWKKKKWDLPNHWYLLYQYVFYLVYTLGECFLFVCTEPEMSPGVGPSPALHSLLFATGNPLSQKSILVWNFFIDLSMKPRHVLPNLLFHCWC